MQLTKQTVETFIRRVASAPVDELDAIRLSLGKSLKADVGQQHDVVLVTRSVRRILRAQTAERQ